MEPLNVPLSPTFFQTSPSALQMAAPPMEVQPGSSAAALGFAFVSMSKVTTAGAFAIW